MKYSLYITLATALLSFSGCRHVVSKQETWFDLFNGKDLAGWHANTGKGGDASSLPVEKIYTVKDGVIHVYADAPADSKQKIANIYYDEKFSHYHFQVEYRWLENRFKPREKADRDAGILFHVHNDPTVVWPSSVEMQMGDGKPGDKYVTGDLWAIHTLADVPSEDGFYQSGAPLVTRGNLKGKGYDSGMTSIHAENPHGEWNTIDVHVNGSESAMYYLNGILVNEVYNMRYQDETGTWLPLEKGYVSLQAEWAELEYRVVRIRPTHHK